MRVGVVGLGVDEVAAIECLLYPYGVRLTRGLERAEVAICGDASSVGSKPAIRIENSSGNFYGI